MTKVRVNKIVQISNKACDVNIGYFSMDAIPSIGETLNVDGNPYFVIERGWALDNEESDTLYCYLRVFGYTSEPVTS